MVGSGILEGVDNSVCSDLFMEHRDFFDFPMESLEGDGMDEGDWDMKLQALGPIPLEALLGSSLASGGNIGNAASDVVPNLSVPSEDSSELKLMPNFVEEASSANIPFQNDYSNGVGSGVFQAPSPVSVLESSSSCSVDKSLSRSNTLVPGRSRTKRSRRPSNINPWLMMMPPIISTSKRSRHFAPYEALSRSIDFSEFNLPMANPVKRKVKKKKKLSQLSGADEEGNSSQRPIAAKRCSHCKVTKTPQWREGPMGPKTLCNACGVRYRSGRLFPEYRPAASPTFVLSLHSNSHRKVIEMRNKATQVAASPHKGFQEAAIAETRPPMSPPPEFIPMTSYLYDCILGSRGSTPIMKVLPE